MNRPVVTACASLTVIAAFFFASPLVNEAHANSNSAYCLATSGESVTNTCGYTVNIAWYDGSWKAWFLDPGESNLLPSLVRSANVYACDNRRGGLVYSAGRPVGCR